MIDAPEPLWLRAGIGRWMLVLALMGLVFWEISINGGNMQDSVVDLTAAIVEDGRLSIDPYYTNSPDTSVKDGHHYSGMAPGASVLAIPCYIAARALLAEFPAWRERLWRSQLPSIASSYSRLRTPHAPEQMLTHRMMTVIFGHLGGALGMWLVWAIALAMAQAAGAPNPRRTALMAALAYAFATPMTYYEASYFTQSMAVLALLGAAYCGFVLPKGMGAVASCGLLAALAGSIDYPAFAYGGLIAAAAALRCATPLPASRLRPALARFCALSVGFAVPLALVLVYHKLCFGSPFKPPYAFRASNAFHTTGVEGVNWPTVLRWAALEYSPEEGLLWRAPLCLLAPIGGAILWARVWGMGGKRSEDRHRLRLLSLLGAAQIAAAGLYFVSVPWRSDMAAYGPRFFLAGLPWLVIFAAFCGSASRPIARAVFWALFFAGAIVNHLHCIGLDIPLAIDNFSSGTQATPGPLHVFTKDVMYFFSPGGLHPGAPPAWLALAIDAAWIALLLGVFIGWPVRRANFPAIESEAA